MRNSSSYFFCRPNVVDWLETCFNVKFNSTHASITYLLFCNLVNVFVFCLNTSLINI